MNKDKRDALEVGGIAIIVTVIFFVVLSMNVPA